MSALIIYRTIRIIGCIPDDLIRNPSAQRLDQSFKRRSHFCTTVCVLRSISAQRFASGVLSSRPSPPLLHNGLPFASHFCTTVHALGSILPSPEEFRMNGAHFGAPKASGCGFLHDGHHFRIVFKRNVCVYMFRAASQPASHTHNRLTKSADLRSSV